MLNPNKSLKHRPNQRLKKTEVDKCEASLDPFSEEEVEANIKKAIYCQTALNLDTRNGKPHIDTYSKLIEPEAEAKKYAALLREKEELEAVAKKDEVAIKKIDENLKSLIFSLLKKNELED